MQINYKLQRIIFIFLFFVPTTLYASFIESTMGAAVVNDATATYYNPAALTLLKNPQIIPLSSISYFHSNFTGQAIQKSTGFAQSGSTSSNAHYLLPTLYFGLPIKHKVTLGMAVITNFINRDVEGNSILRYAQSNNSVQDIDLVPAVGVKINQYVALGAGMTLSYASFLLQPISGFPSLNIPDSQSRNDSSGTGIGGNAGLLFTPSPATLIGFNYRSAITYNLTGKSILAGHPGLTSNRYSFNFWTPAHSVVSISHFVTPTLGFIGTVQRVQWSIFKNINIHGIATQVGPRPMIVNATVPFHYRDTWILTLGTNYYMTSKWIIRVAGSYVQSPGNPRYQITNGDSIILGLTTGYEINKNITLDGGYAHAFFQNENINITTGRNFINGVNKGFVNAFSLKVTFNI